MLGKTPFATDGGHGAGIKTKEGNILKGRACSNSFECNPWSMYAAHIFGPQASLFHLRVHMKV